MIDAVVIQPQLPLANQPSLASHGPRTPLDRLFRARCVDRVINSLATPGERFEMGIFYA
jgi:hypothetical protein